MEFFRKKTPTELNKQKEQTEEAIGASFVVSDDIVLDEREDIKKIHPRQYEIYLRALRAISKTDYEKLPGQFLDEATYLELMKNLDDYLNSSDFNEVLRGHQQNVIQAVMNALEQGLSEGYIEMPTGSGKTAIFSKLIQSLTGDRNSTKKLKTLILVPGKDLASQTVGYDYNQDDVDALVSDIADLSEVFDTDNNQLLSLNKEYRQKFDSLDKESSGGLAKFADNIKVKELHCGLKDIGRLNDEFVALKNGGDQDALVITYKSLVTFSKEGLIDQDDFGLIICDEAHRAMGEATAEALNKLKALKIGLTASVESRDKHVDDLFETCIFKMSLLQAIFEKVIMTPRVINHYSNKVIQMKVGSNDEYTEESQKELIDMEDRNDIAVNYAREFIENGLQGIISCVPGNNLEHPKLLAEMLNKLEVIDHDSGQPRKARAICVGGGMDGVTRQVIYSLLETGKIDVITFVEVLKEGWDSNAAKFLINLRPTRSKITAIQRLGRILRFPKKENVKVEPVVVDILDDLQEQGYFNDVSSEAITASSILSLDEQNKRIKDSKIDIENNGEARSEADEVIVDNHLFLRPEIIRDRLGLSLARLKDLFEATKDSTYYHNARGLDYFDGRGIVKTYKELMHDKLVADDKKWMTPTVFIKYVEIDPRYESAILGLYDFCFDKLKVQHSQDFVKKTSINQKTREVTYNVHVMLEALQMAALKKFSVPVVKKEMAI